MNSFRLKRPSDGKSSRTTCLWVKASTASMAQYFPTIIQMPVVKFVETAPETFPTLMACSIRFLLIRPYPPELVFPTIRRTSTFRMGYITSRSRTQSSKTANPCSEITKLANKIKQVIHRTHRTVAIHKSTIADMDKISSRSWLGTMLRRWHLSWTNPIIVSI